MKFSGNVQIGQGNVMVGFESPGIELPWWRSVLSECSCFDVYIKKKKI